MIPATKTDYEQHTHKLDHRRNGIADQLKLNNLTPLDSSPTQAQDIELNNNNHVPGMAANGTAPNAAKAFISNFMLKQSAAASSQVGSVSSPASSLVLSMRDLPPAFTNGHAPAAVPQAPVVAAPPPKAGRPFIVRLGTIPWTTTKQQLVDYFREVNVPGGVNGVHFIVRNEVGKPNNAYMALANKDEFERIKMYKSEHVSIQGNRENGHTFLAAPPNG